ncbi:N-acetyltransferase [Paralimibaculum aggregatum]|uniref:N-acetyltransferase n=1 Tax=Paralimibaculum aggregatum TaxID=3036245 RepID=A0ABQ6LP46_9RHOB|nr:N-acetyltransferase [Limibaculum sp. NKW23]GMG82191.1 N-acetyltransferase [Limibaculum sp. NKW23]
MLRFLPETETDLPEVEGLLDLAFAPGRELLSSYQLRQGVPPVAGLSMIARDDYDALVGAIRFWPVRVGAAGDPALLLGPVAVHPIRQGEGIGAALIGETLERAAESGWPAVILVGDEPYYRRFGFTRAAAEALDFPRPVNPARVLARALRPDGLAHLAGAVRPWS